jgi:putative intracellular protease/amidase
MIPHGGRLHVGSLLFEGVDQIDLTGPFEVLSRIPNSTYRIYGKTTAPVRDIKGLRLTPEATLDDAPPLDVLHVPGGYGQEALMEDADVLGWIRQQASEAPAAFSRCARAPLSAAQQASDRCASSRRSASKRRSASSPNSASPRPPPRNDRAGARAVWREPRVYWRVRQQPRS